MHSICPETEDEPRPTVILVGEHADTLDYLQLVLAEEEVCLLQARDGFTALPLIARVHPDLILLDVHLPDLNGYHLCQMIRKNLQLKHAVIIVIGTRNGLLDALRARWAGATTSLKTPVDSAIVAQLVVKYLSALTY